MIWCWCRNRGKELKTGGERSGRKRRQERPLVFFIILIYKDFTHMISILTAILQKAVWWWGQTIIDFHGFQILELRFKDSKPYARWWRHLLHSGPHRPAARPGSPLGPPASQHHSLHSNVTPGELSWTSTGLLHRFEVRKSGLTCCVIWSKL